jgi:MFS family permease
MQLSYSNVAGKCGSEAESAGASNYAWLVFALTFGLLLSDYMSRQVLNAVFPLLKAEWGLSDTRLGTLSGVVSIAVGALALPLSLLADRWGRLRRLVLMAALWSIATLACALASNFDQMLVALLRRRGEAAYAVAWRWYSACFRCGCARRSAARSSPAAWSGPCSASLSAASSPPSSAGAQRLPPWHCLDSF